MKLLCHQQQNPIVLLGFCDDPVEKALEERGTAGSVVSPLTNVVFDLEHILPAFSFFSLQLCEQCLCSQEPPEALGDSPQPSEMPC